MAREATMIDETESIIQGETFRVGVSIKLSSDDSGLVDADLVVFDTNNFIILEKTGQPFQPTAEDPTEFVADLSVTNTNISVGTYEYFVRINWDDGTNDIVPDGDCIESQECEYPKLIICPKPTAGVS